MSQLAEQLTFDIPQTVQRADNSKEQRLLERARVPASFLPEPPQLSHRQQSSLARLLLEEELQRQDPADSKVPAVGDRIEMLYPKWRAGGWLGGTVLYVYPPFVTARMDEGEGRWIWTAPILRSDWRRNPNIDKGPLWRWPAGAFGEKDGPC